MSRPLTMLTESPEATADDPLLVRVAHGALDLRRGRFLSDAGAVVRLSSRETRLLAYLHERAGEDVSRDDLLSDVWGHHALSMSRAVDTAVARLRKKIEPDPSVPTVLCTAHGEGYRLVTDAPAAEPAPPPAAAAPVLLLNGARVDLGSGVVERGTERTVLTSLERRLLLELGRRPGALVEAGRLARKAEVTGGRAALCNAIHRLRKKIEADPSEPVSLLGVRGQGYRLEARLDTAPDALQARLRALAAEAAALLGVDDFVIHVRGGTVLAHATSADAPLPLDLAA